MWLLDLSHQLPPTVKLYGFDVSSKQYPAKELWPKRLCLLTMDSLQPPPADLMGQFDVVHLRMWASNVTQTTLPALVSHIRCLLSIYVLHHLQFHLLMLNRTGRLSSMGRGQLD